MPNTWADFERQAPELATFGAGRINGRVGYLATLRADGYPRLHPVTPIVGGGHSFVFMEPTSPKGKDLQRDPKFALHCAVEDNDGGAGEFLLHGVAELVTDAKRRAIAVQHASYSPAERYILFELYPTEAFSTLYENDKPTRQRWKAP